jgi:hypothetical protein
MPANLILNVLQKKARPPSPCHADHQCHPEPVEGRDIVILSAAKPQSKDAPTTTVILSAAKPQSKDALAKQ